MFKKKTYNVAKKTKTKTETETETASAKSTTMTLKKKDKIKSANKQESPEYQKKTLLKKPTSGWVQNKTFEKKEKKEKEKEKK